MPTINDVIKAVRKKHGPEFATRNPQIVNLERIPTGIFPMDLMLGGGFPRGKIITAYGGESGGKTNLAFLTIVQAQTQFPLESAVFVDAEHSYDPTWARKMGIKNSNLVLFQPDFGEQAIDMVSQSLASDDVSIIVVDSLAALVTGKEMENDADKQQVAGNSLMIGKLCRKALHGLTAAHKRGRYPLVLLLNQIRTKVGIVYGSPDYMPGGHALLHVSSGIIKIYGKNLMDKALSDVLPAYKSTKVSMPKWKFPVVATSCEYDMAMVAQPGLGIRCGQIENEWKTLSYYMAEQGLIKKEKTGGWLVNGFQVSSMVEARDYVYSSQKRLTMLKNKVIKKALSLAQADESPL